MSLVALIAAVAPLWVLCPKAQDPDLDLAALLRAEAQRVEVMAKVAPAVCSVMPLDAPGGGSGVIFDPAGFVLTNFHVVGNPQVERMKIGLPDGALYGASVLGVDPGSDLAVLLLDPRPDEAPWPFAALGDSDALLVGQHVFAMGNPFLLATDFRPTTTWGIVSGTHRYQPGRGNRALVYPDCIQVDVPINPGNSGGPLFDMQGRVVGINGRISVGQRGRVNVGVGFAIASRQILNFLPDLVAGRFAEHGTLDLNAWYMAEGDRRGVHVQAIFADSAVTDFGLALGDELTSFGGVPIRSANQLATLVGVLPAGTWVSLGFRPTTADGARGDERVVEFALRRLDTGSSRDEDRLATAAQRRLGLRALAREVGRGEALAGATLRFVGPDEAEVVVQRAGRMLRIDGGGVTLVRRDDEDGFRIDAAGEVGALRPDERQKLDRILATNPFLWRGPQHRAQLDGALLAGGVMAGGKPGFRARLSGDGDCEVWFHLDGEPAGCRYRDPLRAQTIELYRDSEGGARIVTDGDLSARWRMTAPDLQLPPAARFERPVR